MKFLLVLTLFFYTQSFSQTDRAKRFIDSLERLIVDESDDSLLIVYHQKIGTLSFIYKLDSNAVNEHFLKARQLFVERKKDTIDYIPLFLLESFRYGLNDKRKAEAFLSSIYYKYKDKLSFQDKNNVLMNLGVVQYSLHDFENALASFYKIDREIPITYSEDKILEAKGFLGSADAKIIACLRVLGDKHKAKGKLLELYSNGNRSKSLFKEIII